MFALVDSAECKLSSAGKSVRKSTTQDQREAEAKRLRRERERSSRTFLSVVLQERVDTESV